MNRREAIRLAWDNWHSDLDRSEIKLREDVTLVAPDSQDYQISVDRTPQGSLKIDICKGDLRTYFYVTADLTVSSEDCTDPE